MMSMAAGGGPPDGAKPAGTAGAPDAYSVALRWAICCDCCWNHQSWFACCWLKIALVWLWAWLDKRIANAALHDIVLLHCGLLPGLHALGLELHGGCLPVVGAQQGGGAIRAAPAAVAVAWIELGRSGASQPEAFRRRPGQRREFDVSSSTSGMFGTMAATR